MTWRSATGSNPAVRNSGFGGPPGIIPIREGRMTQWGYV